MCCDSCQKVGVRINDASWEPGCFVGISELQPCWLCVSDTSAVRRVVLVLFATPAIHAIGKCCDGDP